jgi:methylenetetrahydrofolate reductase (NADPH)
MALALMRDRRQDVTMPEQDRRQRVVALFDNYAIETTPGQAEKVESFRDLLPPGTTVNVTFLPGTDWRETVRVAVRLRGEGLNPVPHFAARSLPDEATFEAFLAALVNEAGVDEVLAIGGGVDQPVGVFDSAMQLLETGLFDRYGIRRIGVAGHPEGSREIGPPALRDALAWKNAFAERSDAAFYIVTQFCFEAAPVIAWDQRIRAEGNRLPIHIGVPGPATLKSLIAYARACGVGPSMRVLTRRAGTLTKLATVQAPDKLVAQLADYRATDPDCGIAKVHMYPLGGFRRTTRWIDAIRAGAFRLRRDGFNVDVDL